MEEKLFIMGNLEMKKGFSFASQRNVSPGCRKRHSKLFKHSKSKLILTFLQKKAKNVLELPKKAVEIFILLEALNIDKSHTGHSQSLSGAFTFKRRDNQFFNNRRGLGKMERTSGQVKESKSDMNDDGGGEAFDESFKTEHSPEKCDMESSINNNNNNKDSIEKTGEYNANSHHDVKARGKGTLTKMHSDNGTFMSFEEIESGESDDSKMECISNSEIRNVPQTVQDWINHLPSKNGRSGVENCDPKEEKSEAATANIPEYTPLLPAKLSREASVQSNSSLDSLLDLRRPDPVEIFLNLGFGGVPGVDMENCRIPRRFLVPSKCKGGDWNEFLRRELIQAQNFECSSLGFRGLSGPSYRRPSAIVANIMEKLRERSVSQSYTKSRFSSPAKKVSTDNSQNRLTPEFQSVLSPDSRKFLENQGKISPEVTRRRIIFGQKSFAFAHNGEFIEVEPSGKGVEGSADRADSDRSGPPLRSAKVDAAKGGAGAGAGKLDETTITPDNLLKLRRCSLQKQKRVDEDDGGEGVGVAGPDALEPTATALVSNSKSSSNKSSGKANNGSNSKNNSKSNKNMSNAGGGGGSGGGGGTSNSTCSSNNNNSNNNGSVGSTCSNKIPKRFLSSTSLKNLDVETNMSDVMRREVEMEILSLSQKIKDVSDRDLVSILKQVKQLSLALENPTEVSFEL